MKGVNFGGWFSQIDNIEEKDPITFPGMMGHIDSFIREQDFEQVKAWGFDHVRLPLDWNNAFTLEIKPREEVLSRYDNAVKGLTKRGLRVIVDLHRCPGHNFEAALHGEQSFFSNASQRKDCLKIWSILAERLGSVEGILLEPLNEPVAPDSQTWNAVKAEIACEIRRFAPKATLLIGSNRWNTPSEFEHLTPLDDDNVVYSFHYYLPTIFTHQKAPWVANPAFQQTLSFPGDYPVVKEMSNLTIESGLWDKRKMYASMQDVFDFREKYQVQVACNEFGVYMAGPDRQSQMNWMQAILEIFKENEIGWSYWTYKNLDFGLVSKGEQLFEHHAPYDNPQRTDLGLVELMKQY